MNILADGFKAMWPTVDGEYNRVFGRSVYLFIYFFLLMKFRLQENPLKYKTAFFFGAVHFI